MELSSSTAAGFLKGSLISAPLTCMLGLEEKIKVGEDSSV